MLSLLLSLSLVILPAAGNSCNQTSQSTFFIGNSFTYYNDMPSIYENILNEVIPGMATKVDSNTQGGRGLYDPIPQDQKEALEQQVWDFVILQDYSETPGLPDSNTNKQGSMSTLDTYYHPTIKTDSLAKAIMYETWGYCCGDSNYPQYYDFQSMNDLLQQGYQQYQALMGIGEPPADEDNYSVHISPVGQAFKLVYQDDIANGNDPLKSGQFISLYVPLSGGGYDKHPSQFGSYLIANTFVSALNGVSTVGTSYYPTGKPTAGPKMTTQQRDYAQQVATRLVLQNELNLNYTYPYQLCPEGRKEMAKK